MSWRLLFAALLVILGIAAWSGIQLGDWLVAHAPIAAPAPGQDDDASQQPVLDANGKPYVAQPPQPRIDGTLGVPDKQVDQTWQVNTLSLFETVSDPSVLISRSRISMEEARQIAAAGGATLPPDASDVTTLDLPGMGGATNALPVTPAQHTAQNSVNQGQMPVSPNQGGNWHDALRRDLAHCSSLGFFERPSCSWNARNKYCEPNQAWGSIAECPNKPY